MESVVQGTQIRIHFALQVSRQKSQFLSCLNGRPREDNPVYLVGFKGGNRLSHGKIGFSRSRRTNAENNHFIINGLHIFLLSPGLRLHRFAHDRMTDDIAVKLRHGSNLAAL